MFWHAHMSTTTQVECSNLMSAAVDILVHHMLHDNGHKTSDTLRGMLSRDMKVWTYIGDVHYPLALDELTTMFQP
jgi:hypothetical protein